MSTTSPLRRTISLILCALVAAVTVGSYVVVNANTWRIQRALGLIGMSEHRTAASRVRDE